MRTLVTGATGYVGSRLVQSLLAEGHQVLAATRGADLSRFAWAGDVTAVSLDVDDEASVRAATRGVDAVVYLVHALDEGNFVRKDRAAARRVAAACEANGVQRIVYLSGLIPTGKDVDQLSAHLRSRLEVEEIFLGSAVPTVSLRAAMVVGSGSTSFELLRRLTERIPFVTPLPTWLASRMQPVAVEDVVALLAAALRGPVRNRSYDVGGPEVVTYAELLALFATVTGLRRLQVRVPFVPRWLVGLVAAAIAEMPTGTVLALVRSLSYDMVCHEDDAVVDLLGGEHDFLSLREAIERSLDPARDATSKSGDLQVGAATDPAWAGGVISLHDGSPVASGNPLVDLLLGLFLPRGLRPATAG